MQSVALLLAAVLAAPVDPSPAVPNWSAPPYWTPPAAARLAAGGRETDGADGPETIPTSPLVLVGIAPCRVVDTRGTAGVPYNTGGKMNAGESRSYDLDSAPAPCNGVPAGAEAFSVNVTATEPEGPGFLSAYPTGPVPDPLTSLVNYATSENVANASVVPADATGSITILTSTRTHVVVDVNGYYVPLSSQTGPVVTSLAGGTGALTLSGTNGITASRVGQAITVTSNATSNATASTIAVRDPNGLLKSTGLDLGLLESSSNLVFSNGARFLHRTSGGLFLGRYTGNLTTSCGTCIGIGDGALEAVANFGAQVAIGYDAMKSHYQGGSNVAVGYRAIYAMTSGSDNVALGAETLEDATTGSYNTAVGYRALANFQTGSDNVAIGRYAGNNTTSGSNNVYVGSNAGPTSAGAESDTIRIGMSTNTAAYVGGIYGRTSASGVAVFANSSGKLGTTTSSRRYKTEVEDVGDRREVLGRLRPVTFLYREDLDPDRVRQYGLIAEEVAEVAPDLVVLGEDGKPETVRYHLLVPLLLDAFQKQQREIQELRRRLAAAEPAGRDLE